MCDFEVFAGTKKARGESQEVTLLSERQWIGLTVISVIILQSNDHGIPTVRSRTLTDFDIQSGDAVGLRGEGTSDGEVDVVCPVSPGTIL